MSLTATRRVSQVSLMLLLLTPALSLEARGQADVQGQWSTLSYTMPINPIHVAMLHNGKILVVAGSGNCAPGQSGCPTGAPYGPSNSSGALVLDPSTGNMTQLSISWDMFCNSMTQLVDGRILINGGTLTYQFLGSVKSSIFDPSNNTFTDQPDMAHGRWYPSVVLLSDGRVMTFSGLDDVTGATNTTVEFFTAGSGYSTPVSAGWTPPTYPRLHLLPNGNVFYSAPSQTSRLFNVTTKAWSVVGASNYGSRSYGSSVMLPLTPANNYDPKIIILGGNSPATATTEIIDMGAGAPTWVYGPDMSQARVEMDAVMLPSGKVLAIGGSSTDEVASTASLNADLYDPNTNSFSSAGQNVYARLYHTTSLLLPDATVWLAGGNPARGNYEPHMEIYKPAYLFTRDGNNNVVAATRPTISSAPTNVTWGGQFTVSTPDAASISQAVLVRPGSSTHAFDMDQRLVGMNFTAGSSSLTVTAPPNSKIAPAGYYMLFLLNSAGVPSVAKFVLLNGTGNPAPTVSSISPSSGTANGGTPVTITGTGFSAGATVKLGGTAATGVTVISSTSITATTAAHSAGTVDVVVTNSDSQSGTLSGGYTYTSSGGGGISFVQVTSAVARSGSSISVTFTAAQTAGNLNVVSVMWGDTTASVTSVTDSRGNSYALAQGPTRVTGLSSAIYYAKNIAAGSNTVTINFSPSAAFPNVNVLEYSGLSTTSPLDVAVGATGTGTTANSGSATTTSASELIFGAGNPTSAFTAAGSGFNNRLINSYGGIAEDKIVSSTGSYNATATLSSGTWVMQMIGFRGAGQGSQPAPTVSSISPNSGTANGGTPVTITGTGFSAGATVKLGGTAATGVTVISSTSITATTAAHSAGTVDVVVTNSDSQSGTLSGGYTYTSSGGGGISFVQVTSAVARSGSSISVTFTAAQTAGNLNVVSVMWGDTTASVTSVTDSRGNSYALAQGPTRVTGLSSAIYYAKNIAAGSNTVTINFSPSAAFPNVNVLEYSGLSTTSPLDVAVGATGTGTTANSGSATTTSASELIFGAGNPTSAFTAAGSGFNNRLINSYGGIAEDKIVSSTGSYNATATLSSGTWVMQMVGFKQ